MLKLKKIPTEKWDNKLSDMPYSPSVNFDTKQIPEIKDWEVGETYQVVFEIKQMNKSENKDGMVNAGFDILGYKILGEDMSDTDIEEMQAEGLSNNKS